MKTVIVNEFGKTEEVTLADDKSAFVYAGAIGVLLLTVFGGALLSFFV